MNVTTPLFGDMYIAYQLRDIRRLYEAISEEKAKKKWNSVLHKDESNAKSLSKRTVIVLTGCILPVIRMLFQNHTIGSSPHLVRIKTKEKKNNEIKEVNVIGIRITGGLYGSVRNS